MHKECYICKQELSLDSFNKNSTAKDGLQRDCKECSRKRMKAYYHDMGLKDIHAARAKNRSKKIQAVLNEIKASIGCCCCDEKDPCALDMHHLDSSTKEKMISRLHRSISKLLTELKKCVIICSNCHRKVHAGRIKIDKRKTIVLNEIVTNKLIACYKRKSKLIGTEV